ncbi:MAG: hypothetical protein QXE51_03680 [Nitrososphaeria archaeon]
MEDNGKKLATIVIVLFIIAIVIGYLYSQGWFATITPYFEKFIKVIWNLLTF